MAFYKKESDGSILVAKSIATPLGTFDANNQNAPDGWVWFDVAEDAYAEFAQTSGKVSARQLKLALLESGDLAIISAIVAAQPQAVQIEWNEASYFERDNATLAGMVAYLSTLDAKWTSGYVDNIFTNASTK